MRDHPHLLFAPADALAQRAAALLERMQDEALDVSRKQHLDVVTTADLASERLILDGLRALTPQASIFSEEAGGSIGEFGWIVDPLDGTVNHASGLPWFSVTLAYLEEGKTVFGLAHAPKAGLIALRRPRCRDTERSARRSLEHAGPLQRRHFRRAHLALLARGDRADNRHHPPARRVHARGSDRRVGRN